MAARKLLVSFAVVQILLFSGWAHAEQIPTQKPTDVKSRCKASGGVYFPKTGRHSTYGCINRDGSGIVCGGRLAKHKRTCDTFLQTPPRLPTRPEVDLATEALVGGNSK